MSKVMPRKDQLADALFSIAEANHYMVGLVEKVTLEELSAAQQILIGKQNRLSPKSTAAYRLYSLALDLVEQEYRKVLQNA